MPVVNLDAVAAVNPTVLTVKQGKNGTQIVGTPSMCRRLLFLIADVVWPEWFENPTGRAQYLKWADECKDGQINVANSGFWHKAKARVMQHLELDGVIVYMANEPAE